MTTPSAATPCTFSAADGTTLHGDLVVPADARAAAIVCHPHPQYGGNRFDHVVTTLFDALPAARIAALRFDFRPTFDDGRGEALDAAGALRTLADAVPDVPLIATGYSFGAIIVLALADPAIRAKVLIAPPLAMADVEPGMPVPTLVLTPAHDQFSPPERSAPIVATWPQADHDTIESADHFLTGRAGAAAAAVVDGLERWLTSIGA